ncbi:MmgE/PrpD family protein [Bordetella sp. 02P26C-1]|uniref:MmgE/PrpD family protein n=1 Tax=Bordetella sp. 02P26C-1 TaxID=2683195 RepID=UPI001352B54A|nr:MmgE/PrpD family protein [Bordetella sp. 02P26C-1]MVW78258.1 MmgE/PrpD family protein [Bordetella sp. 02P26C-1]
MHAIEELAQFVAHLPAGSLQGPARDSCALLVFDLMSATVAGVGSDLAIAARGCAKSLYGEGVADVWLSGGSLSVAGAAMANSAAASALDIDDGHRGAAGHPGAGVIPAVMAVAQALGSSDEDIFDAIAVGYEVGLRTATARPIARIDTYATGRWVNYGVAAAAARLLRLDAKQTAHALAIAGAEGPIGFPSGSSKYQGSTVKEQIPAAVVVGLTAAYRAREGATGPIDLLDSEDNYRREVLTGGLGEHWWLQDSYIKPYACCRYMHAAIDAILAMRRPGAPIKSLRIETFARGLKLVNERAPTTLEGAQYSYYFSCALAAVHGAAALQPVDPRVLTDAEVLALAARVELAAHDDFAQSFPQRTPCRVVMDQGHGPETMTVEFPLGDVANPMSQDQVAQKFINLARGNLATAQRDQMVAALQGLTTRGFMPLFESWRAAC